MVSIRVASRPSTWRRRVSSSDKHEDESECQQRQHDQRVQAAAGQDAIGDLEQVDRHRQHQQIDEDREHADRDERAASHAAPFLHGRLAVISRLLAEARRGGAGERGRPGRHRVRDTEMRGLATCHARATNSPARFRPVRWSTNRELEMRPPPDILLADDALALKSQAHPLRLSVQSARRARSSASCAASSCSVLAIAAMRIADDIVDYRDGSVSRSWSDMPAATAPSEIEIECGIGALRVQVVQGSARRAAPRKTR